MHQAVVNSRESSRISVGRLVQLDIKNALREENSQQFNKVEHNYNS